MAQKITSRWMHENFVAPAGDNIKDGFLNLYKFITEGLETGKVKASDISISEVASAMGVVDRYDVEGSVRKLGRQMSRLGHLSAEELFMESVAGNVSSTAFQAVTGDILTSAVKEAYSTDGNYVGDQLVTVQRSTSRNERIATMQGMGGLLEVPENHPYEETGLGERWIQAEETKYGRVISVTMEALLFDKSGAIQRSMAQMGVRAREKREEIIMKGVMDSLDNSKKVWKPQGVPTTLYATSSYNLIGTSGAPTGYTSAIPLASWQDLDKVLTFRATQVKDDRVDGTQMPIVGLNGPNNVLLIPYALKNAAFYATQYTGQENGDATGPRYQIPVNQSVRSQVGPIVFSPYVDAVSTTTWYYGNFKDQFLLHEILPVTTFTQGADSESAFDRDVNLRVKIRWMAGISALDNKLVTRVIGA